MFYRPNFCCNCGEKIERAAWPLSASRKFCDLCQSEYKLRDWAPRAMAVVGLVVIVAGVSSFFRPAPETGSGGSKKARSAVSDLQIGQSKVNSNATLNPSPQSQLGTNANIPADTISVAKVNPKAQPAKNADEPIYYCGAMTKKGTPCTRRVKKLGDRCWQHAGMPSMLETGSRISR